MRKYSKYLFGLSAIFCIFGFLLIFVSQLMEYAIFTFTISVICLLTGIILFIRYRDPSTSYESRVQGILNTFDSILVRSSTIPSLEGRNIVPVMTMDDLVDAQLEIRKPICYLKQTESCSFVLLDEKEAYIYVEKIREDIESPVEIAIRDIKIQNKSKNDMDSEMLREIDKTTIVKLSNQKSYRVSPIRKKKKEIEMLDQTTSIPTVKNKKAEEVEMLDQTLSLPKVNKKQTNEVEFLDQTLSIPVVKNKKKSFLEHTQVLEELDDIEEVQSIDMAEVEML